MTYQRLSAGIYRDPSTGKTVRSAQNPANMPQKGIKPVGPAPQAQPQVNQAAPEQMPQNIYGQSSGNPVMNNGVPSGYDSSGQLQPFATAAPGQNQQMQNSYAQFNPQTAGQTFQQQNPQFQGNQQGGYQNPLNGLQQGLRSPYGGGY